jgi:TatD DNase family protein
MTTAPFVDTHCHLDAYFRANEPAAEAARSGVEIVAVTNLPSHRERLTKRLAMERNVHVALGAHPAESSKMHEEEWRIFTDTVVKADYIGEVGLDFSPGADRLVQERVFARVLSIVQDRPRFITIHSRRAVRASLKYLADARLKPAVFHWFSGSAIELAAILDAGHLVSINTSMLVSAKGINIIQTAPRDRILAESDGPYARHRGKPASPSDVVNVYEALARFWGADLSDVRTQLAENFANAKAGIVSTPSSLF